MTEITQPEAGLQEVSRDQVKTDLGTVIKYDVLFRGKPRTVYSSRPSTDIHFLQELRDVETAEHMTVEPGLVRNLAAEGTTPEQFIETGSHKYIVDLRTGGFTREIQNHVLFPLVKQKALDRLYKEAKQTPKPQ